jgi:hypothetical protein
VDSSNQTIELCIYDGENTGEEVRVELAKYLAVEPCNFGGVVPNGDGLVDETTAFAAL